jgi:hypothetical protein
MMLIQRIRMWLAGRTAHRHWQRYVALRDAQPLACEGELNVEGPMPVFAECAAYDGRDCGFRFTLHDRSELIHWSVGSDDMADLQLKHHAHSRNVARDQRRAQR